MEDEKIMVVERTCLFGDSNEVADFQGFIPADQASYEEKTLKNFSYMERSLAEENSAYKQPIAYAIVLNALTKKVFAYRRSKKDVNYPEKRLQGKWSWGVGGHIQKLDEKNGNPILDSMARELVEELDFQPISVQLLGYINDDSNSVGKVHIGFLYLIETSNDVSPQTSEIEIGGMKSFAELEALVKEEQVENWSIIAMDVLKDYLKL
jgi:predicted NUDIX family phosphoesterase